MLNGHWISHSYGQLIQSTKASWWETVHTDEMDARLARISLPSMKQVRQIANFTAPRSETAGKTMDKALVNDINMGIYRKIPRTSSNYT